MMSCTSSTADMVSAANSWQRISVCLRRAQFSSAIITARLLALNPAATPRLRAHIIAAHTDVADVGRIAAAANVKRLVLSHLVPAYDPTLTEASWSEPARRHYTGEIIVGARFDERVTQSQSWL